jgi:hypothetical protein
MLSIRGVVKKPSAELISSSPRLLVQRCACDAPACRFVRQEVAELRSEVALLRGDAPALRECDLDRLQELEAALATAWKAVRDTISQVCAVRAALKRGAAFPGSAHPLPHQDAVCGCGWSDSRHVGALQSLRFFAWSPAPAHI